MPLAGASGCGFKPLYGPVETVAGGTEHITAELAAVRVGPISERFGQMLRRDLQRRLEGNAPGTQARYALNVTISFRTEVLGFRNDGTISRLRYVLSGNWTLATQAVPPRVIARNSLPFRTIDASNVPDLQFFAADSAREAMEQRLLTLLADEVVREVTLSLRDHIAALRAATLGKAERPSAS